jgi:sugar lactone lactonase YvrE
MVICMNSLKPIQNQPFMTRAQHLITATCLFLSAGLFINSCKKTSTPPSGSTTPPGSGTKALSILSITPESGPDSTQVTIIGTGFNTMAAQDSLFINGKNASIIHANDSVLVVLVPLRAGTGNVSVKANGIAITGPVFTYKYTTTEILLAGNGNINGVDGQGKAASFFFPTGVAMEPNGYLLVSQAASGTIRMVSPTGQVQSLATAFIPSIDLNNGTPGVYMQNIEGIAIDNSNGRIWVGDPGDNSVSYFSSTTSPAVTQLVDSFHNVFGADTSTRMISTFEFPTGVAASNGTVFVVDNETNNMQIIDPTGKQIYAVLNTGNATIRGLLNEPSGLAVDASQNLYIANAGGNNILKITNDSVATVFAGSGTKGSADGSSSTASFFAPQAVAVDGSGNVYVSDSYNQRVRMIGTSGTVITFPYQFSYPAGLAVDPTGSTLYVADALSCVIYKITIQ